MTLARRLRDPRAWLLAALGWVCSSCAPSGFADPTVIASVRIMASGADLPYAPPGATVNVSLLAADERPQQPEPMTVYWIPFVCENPQNDAYYACFQQLASMAPDGGTLPSGGADGGVDLSGLLPTGPTYTFPMPADAVTSHPAVAGAPEPYGVAFVFNAACAGHLELLPIDPSNQNPQQIPIGCFDSQHHALGADDWVLGYSRVYAYDTLRNANPVISSVDVNGKTLAITADPTRGYVYAAPECDAPGGCVSMSPCNSGSGGCSVKIGPVVPSSSWELNPEEMTSDGKPSHEELWADYYTTFGSLSDEARLLYDPGAGLVGPPSDTDVTFQAPSSAATGTIWIVVHDSRGGAAWVTVPVLVK